MERSQPQDDVAKTQNALPHSANPHLEGSHHVAPLQVEVHETLKNIPEADWNALANGDFLFADHRFLMALEESGSVGERTGWHPQHLCLRGADGSLEAAMPLYLKDNSYGEYIFDWSWAHAAASSGLPYYPKLVSAIPFTPATGPKILVRPGFDVELARRMLLQAALELGHRLKAHSTHLLFTTEDETKALESAGFLMRDSFQYHWRNREGWRDFGDFLASLRSKRRNEIRREREIAARLPVQIEIVPSEQLGPHHAEIVYGFYRSTTEKMGGFAYLTRAFFHLVFERMRDNVVLVLASANGGTEPVAGAFNLSCGQTLFGRYWGCFEEYKNLHFELCYYRTIEWALAHGVTLFEAGAQGEHKFNRGFTPALCRSAHKIEDPRLSAAVHDFLLAERQGIREMFEDYAAHDPFRGQR